jgi:SAM-dependent methyltransferase
LPFTRLASNPAQVGNVDRAAELYRRESSRYSHARPHGLREFVLAGQRARILELARPRPTDRVLDVGCGAGQIAALLRPNVATICGIDVCTEMLSIARRWLDEVAEARLETLDLGREFDLVVCCGVLDFADDAGAALRAIRRHLAPGGRAIVATAAVSPLGLGYAAVRRLQGIRVRLYRNAQLRGVAERSGLRCATIGRIPGGSVAAVLERDQTNSAT